MGSDWTIVDLLAPVIIKHTHGDCIVDIGMGASTRILAKHSQEYGLLHYSCDRKKFHSLHERHFVFTGDSLDFLAQFPEEKHPGLVFLNGCHDYNYVKAEIEFFLAKLVIHGVIFCHDMYPENEANLSSKGCSDAYKMRQELERGSLDIDIFTWPYTAINKGLTMILKKDPERPEWRR